MDDRKQPPGSDLVAGALATAALGGTFFVLHAPIALAAGVAIAVYGGTKLLIGASLPRARGTFADPKDFLARGRAQLAELQRIGGGASEESVRAAVLGLRRTGDEIFALFESDPTKIPLARGFVEFTLTRALSILNRYQELSSRGIRTRSVQATMENVEALLNTLDESFRKQVDRLVMEQVADLDAEIDFLKARLDFELDEDKKP